MPCICGDMMCPSCGPAQGYDPSFETICEWIECLLDTGLTDCNYTVQEFVNVMMNNTPVARTMLLEAGKYFREYHKQKEYERLEREAMRQKLQNERSN